MTIVGQSPELLAALDTVRRVAESRLPVLIVGATGVGKEVIARYLHLRSGRRGDLIDLDCGALPADLVESLLFGHRRGAFTGAVQHSQGLIERASMGTLFLDELGSLPPAGQSKLLRVLETGCVRRVGETRSRAVDFRLVSTMRESALDSVRGGDFRLDLFQRVAGVVVHLPALADRPLDILPLARHFARVGGVGLSACGEAALVGRPWVGNVRELKWAIHRARLFASDGIIDAHALQASAELGPEHFLRGEPGSAGPLAELRAVCSAHEGNPDRIAQALGIGRSTLYRRLKDAGLELRRFKPGSRLHDRGRVLD